MGVLGRDVQTDVAAQCHSKSAGRRFATESKSTVLVTDARLIQQSNAVEGIIETEIIANDTRSTQKTIFVHEV